MLQVPVVHFVPITLHVPLQLVVSVVPQFIVLAAGQAHIWHTPVAVLQVPVVHFVPTTLQLLPQPPDLVSVVPQATSLALGQQHPLPTQTN